MILIKKNLCFQKECDTKEVMTIMENSILIMTNVIKDIEKSGCQKKD